VSFNSGDYFSMRGRPFPARFRVGFPKPDDNILGWDRAGRVESVGERVTDFQVGDEIYASYESSLAEFSAVPEGKAAKAPANLSPKEAASIPSAASMALQALRDQAHVQPGMIVLANGASGGVGTFTV
jgi:NADPH:quinone reductase-like Zn-dependent oxidoreductase